MNYSKKILLRNGLQASCKSWGNPSSKMKVIAIHGWLDNANSFNCLGPYLGDRGFHVVAYDNIGHGYSSYEPASSNNYAVGTYIGFCREIIDALEWDQFDIVGHSLGAAISCMFSATYPENVKKIALIDGFTTPGV
jgi:pimeloyl-ACP methyl ester carboxylesterase